MILPDAIHTERLIIRPFQETDLDGFLSFMSNDLATRYLLFTDEQKTPQGAQELFDFVISSYTSDDPQFAYAIALKDTNRFVGSCGISEVSGGDVVECYYSLLPDHWKQGFAAEATQALIQYCFRHYSLKEIRAYMSPENPNSSAVAERVGMAYQGVVVHPISGTKAKLYSIARETDQPL